MQGRASSGPGFEIDSTKHAGLSRKMARPGLIDPRSNSDFSLKYWGLYHDGHSNEKLTGEFRVIPSFRKHIVSVMVVSVIVEPLYCTQVAQQVI